MLNSRRLIFEWFCSTAEGVMVYHNDRGRRTKAPKSDRGDANFIEAKGCFKIMLYIELKKNSFWAHLADVFRPVHQSCTASTLLLHMSKSVLRYAAENLTYIGEQALSAEGRLQECSLQLTLIKNCWRIFNANFRELYISLQWKKKEIFVNSLWTYC